MLLFLWAFSLFHHAEPEPVKAGGGFMLRSGRRVIWRLEMDSTPWAFPLVISSQDHWRKESHSGRKKLCVLLWFLHSFFCRLGLGERGRVLKGEASLLWSGPETGLVWPEVQNRNQEVSWSHPSGFTVCRWAAALAAAASSCLPHYVSLKKQLS